MCLSLSCKILRLCLDFVDVCRASAVCTGIMKTTIFESFLFPKPVSSDQQSGLGPRKSFMVEVGVGVHLVWAQRTNGPG